MNKRYSEVIKLPTLEDRLNYLKLNGKIGDATFGVDRYLNQILYGSNDWKRLRREIVIRDNGLDLAMPGFEIFDKVYVHHINPITVDDVLNNNPIVMDPENLISCSYDMHYAIHYGGNSVIKRFVPVERKPNDTCPWRK